MGLTTFALKMAEAKDFDCLICAEFEYLEDVRNRKVNVAFGRGVEELGALDDHQVRGEVHAPRQRRCRHQNLSGSKSSFLIALVCNTSCWILASASTDQRPEEGDLTPL